MNDLQKAYSVLGLEPGAPMEAVKRRHKRLVLVWHPDRFHNVEGKLEAEQELKRINHANDILKEHFLSGGHKESGHCACRPESGEPSARAKQSAHGPGPNPDSNGNAGYKKPDPHAAGKPDAESRGRSDEEASKKAQEAARAAHEQTMHKAFRRGCQPIRESLRWRISLACATIFVLLWIVLIISDGLDKPTISTLKDILAQVDDTDDNRNLLAEWRDYQSDKTQVAYTLLKREPVAGETSEWRPPFVSNDRGVDRLSGLAYEQFEVRAQERKKQSDQDLTTAEMDVERYQKAIEFSQKRLADLAVQLADSGVSEIDRQFAASEQSRQRKFLQESQDNLEFAQKRLSEAKGDGGGNEVTPRTTVPAQPGPTNGLSIGNINMDPVMQPDGSIKGRAGGFLKLDPYTPNFYPGLRSGQSH